MGPRRLFPSLSLAASMVGLGCGGSGSPAADTGTTDVSTTDAPADSSESGSGSESSTTGADDWPYDHGYVKVVFVPPPEAPDPAILEATVTVVVAMDYGECLSAYYDSNPFVQQSGELGAAIFGDSSMGGEGWKELLCSPLFGDHAGCSIVWITQRFDVVQSLTITYDITADLATKPLFFGPLPTAATANCADGAKPMVSVPSAMAFRGIDAAGGDLWEAGSYAPAEAASRDEDPIVVTIAPSATD